jgi:hypothetical protein
VLYATLHAVATPPWGGLTPALGRMYIYRWLLLSLVLIASTASAHRDRILSILSDGRIPEIPASFGPVLLKISGLGSAKPTVELRSGGKLNVLPVCLTRFIHSKKLSDVKVTGSWYHEESTLPYYINIEFNEPGYITDQAYKSNLSILFNLRTTEIIKIERFVADRSGDGGQYLTVDLPVTCKLSQHAA